MSLPPECIQSEAQAPRRFLHSYFRQGISAVTLVATRSLPLVPNAASPPLLLRLLLRLGAGSGNRGPLESPR